MNFFQANLGLFSKWQKVFLSSFFSELIFAVCCKPICKVTYQVRRLRSFAGELLLVMLLFLCFQAKKGVDDDDEVEEEKGGEKAPAAEGGAEGEESDDSSSGSESDEVLTNTTS